MSSRILIAEDDSLQSAVLQAALEQKGYEIETVADGLGVVRKLRTGGFDLALVDYRLPEIDGLAAARLLRDQFGEANRPHLIAVTSSSDSLREKEQTANTNAFDAIFPKSSGMPALLILIETHLAELAKAAALAAAERAVEASREADVVRRRRLLANLATVPALAATLAFGAAFVWAISSQRHISEATMLVAHSRSASTDTAVLLGAVQEAQADQRAYLVTGSDAQRQTFEAAQERVDRLLTTPTSLDAGRLPGLSGEPQAAVTQQMRKLTEEALLRTHDGIQAVASSVAADDQSLMGGLRKWAVDLVDRSQEAAEAGLTGASRKLWLVLAALGIGFVQAAWAFVLLVRRARRTQPAMVVIPPLRKADAAPHHVLIAAPPIQLLTYDHSSTA